ncbi:MAG: diacylglycerol/lipid kinase family protein [Candidatus Thorarchaeota archaeon]
MADNTPFLIINPNANNGKTGKQIDFILSKAKEVFGEFQYELTKKQGDGFRIANKAIKEKYTTLVAIGGDGTLNEILNVAVKTDIRIGMVAKGGSCDAHKTHGIPRNLEKSMQIISEGYSEKFPIGLAKGDTERYFMEMADGAFTGEVAEASHYRMKWLYGDIRYILLAFQKAYSFKPIPSKIIVDNEVREGNIVVFAVALSDVLGGFEIVPKNHPKIGDFAVILGKDYRRMKLIYWLMRALNGGHLKSEKIEILRGKNIVIESESPMFWEAEGEIFSRNAKRLEFSYHTDAYNLIIPKEWNYELTRKEKQEKLKKLLK